MSKKQGREPAYLFEITQKPILGSDIIRTTIEVESRWFISGEFLNEFAVLLGKHLKD